MADLLKTTPQALIGKLCHEVMHGTKTTRHCPHFQTLKTGKSAAMETLILLLRFTSMKLAHRYLMKRGK